MAHPYKEHKEVHAGKKRAKEMAKHFKRGGKVHSDEAEDRALIRKELKKHDAAEHKASGGAVTPRLDKRARGGGVKKHGKGHHTRINIMIAPKGGDAVPPPGLGAGGPPMGAPPMVPRAPMAPPAGALGAGPPGMPPGMPPGAGPKPPGMMKRGGAVPRGIASKENLSHWAKYSSDNTRYAKGGKVPMTAGGDSGEGRLQKVKAYGKRARGN